MDVVDRTIFRMLVPETNAYAHRAVSEVARRHSLHVVGYFFEADGAALRHLTTSKLASEMQTRGLHVGSWYNYFTIAPPLTVTAE